MIYVGFIVLGKEFIQLWMGYGYESVYVCALLLIFPSLIDVPQQIAKTSLLAKDRVKEQAVIYICMAAANIVLSLILIPTLGIIGAAISICAAYLLRTAAFNFLYKQVLEINLKQYFINAYGRWSIIAVFTAIAGIIIAELVPVSGWIGLILEIVLVAAVYAALFLLIGLKKEERSGMIHALHYRRQNHDIH